MEKSRRLIGLDVARAVAILGMIVVNFKGKAKPVVGGFEDLAWWLDRMEGKWAAVFVVLAGVGIGMQAKKAVSLLERARLRRSLLTRAIVLLLIGVLHQHWWSWDILAFYGVYIAASVVFLWAPSSVLWGSIAVLTFGSGWLWMNVVRPELDFWTMRGAVGKLFLWGNHPVVPWFSLLLFGLLLSRLDLRSARTRRHLLMAAGLAFLVAEAANLYVRDGGPGLADPPILDMLRTWPRPTRPGFVVSGIAFATLAIVSIIAVTEGRRTGRLLTALQAGGQMALTLYIAHVPAVILPMAHGWMPESLGGVLAYALAVYAVCIAGALWWRRRYVRGPLEGLLAALTSAPAPHADGSLAS